MSAGREDRNTPTLPVGHALRTRLSAHLHLSGRAETHTRARKLSADTLRRLLARIAAGDSLNAAASSVGVSWRHAWGVVKDAEALLGAQLISTRVGGTGGGGSRLTGAGDVVLNDLEEITAGIKAVVTAQPDPIDRPQHSTPAVLYLAATLESVETGFLDSVAAAFQHDHGVMISVVAAGSGTALALAREGRVDLALTHAPDLERRLLQRGVLEPGLPIMQSCFVIVGPESDPAGVREETADPLQAIRRIARARALFVSRGDNSGTHMRERALWRAAAIEPVPPWYRTVDGSGNRRILAQAAEQSAYAVVDYATTQRWGLAPGQAVLYHDPPSTGDSVMSDRFSFLRVPKGHGPAGGDGYARTTDFLAWFISKRDELVRTGAVDSHGVPLFSPAIPE